MQILCNATAVVLFGTRVRTTDLAPKANSIPLVSDGEPIPPVLDLAIRLGVTLVD